MHYTNRLLLARRFAIVMATFFFLESLLPVTAYALTSGPSQPEVQSFTPYGASDMVDLFSGDFMYNIPLFELPGPDGGYPFNLSYSSGITMDQEASWVGLGWNLTPGAINRQMRGLPDEFNGDEVHKEMDMKPNKTFGGGLTLGIEPMTFDTDKNVTGKKGENFQLGIKVYYNTYSGMGFSLEPNLMFGPETNDNTYPNFSGGLGLSLDSEEGASLNPSLSISTKFKDEDKKYTDTQGALNLGSSYNTRRGMTDLSFGMSVSNPNWNKSSKNKDMSKNLASYSSSISFASTGYTPSINMPMTGRNMSLNFTIGGDVFGVYGSGGISGFYTEQKLSTNEMTSPAYGYLYLDEAYNNARDKDNPPLVEGNRENDGRVMLNSPNLAVPNLTYDVYSIQGQGTGGMFRPYRTDIGVMFDQYTESKTNGGSLGVEVGLGSFVHGEVAGHYNHSNSNSGLWEDQSFTDNYEPQTPYPGQLYQPYYYKRPGEHVSESPSNLKSLIGGDEAIKLNIKGHSLDGTFSNNDDNSVSVTHTDNRSSFSRKPTNEAIVSILNDDAAGMGIFNVKHYKTTNPNFSTYISAPAEDIDRDSRKGKDIGHHPGAMLVQNPNGVRYVYGIPAYNLEHVETQFSVDGDNADCSPLIDIPTKPNGEIKYKIDGTDEFLSKTSLPPYAHSYLLTSILGNDYVDITNDGPSDDDLGYWVKFNYVEVAYDGGQEYAWRAPYTKANFAQGQKSIASDDKGNYMYGTKEVWYLGTAETRTHIAVFEVSARDDAKEAPGELENSAVGSQAYFKLDKIYLYSKAEFEEKGADAIPIKTVNFEYSYELCPGIPNYSGAGSGGKLTLKKVWFEYGTSDKGANNPYEFTYGGRNPEYDSHKYDRWGNFRPYYGIDADSSCLKLEHPYTKQQADYNGDGVVNDSDKTARDADVSAWSMTGITLPSGGEITVNYESDDYAYVQNKQAMQMFPIDRIGKFSSGANKIYERSSYDKNDKRDRRIYFDLEIPLSDALDNTGIQSEMSKYFDGEELYYKLYVNVRAPGDGIYEYLSGYAPILEYGVDSSSVVSSHYTKGYVTLDYAKVGNKTYTKYPPLALAGWQYIRMNLPIYAYAHQDLSEGSAGDTEEEAKANSVIRALASIQEVFSSFYGQSFKKDWASKIDYSRSVIKLNSPDKVKYGGGTRVASIYMSDSWDDLSGENEGIYGQVYEYTITDSLSNETYSSGVAAYEPMIGGEENALRYVKQYPEKIPLGSNNNLFFEYPINEGLYPGASVGYSKVTVKSLNSDNFIMGIPGAGFGVSGVKVHEFYTAKDYPVITDETDLDNDSKNRLYLPIGIPGIGTITIENLTMTQGYSIELNDMHGKQRRVSTYGIDENGNILTTADSWVEYFYKDKVIVKNGAPSYRQLKSEVEVIVSDTDPDDESQALIESRVMGVDYDLFTDLRHSKSTTTSGGLEMNGELPIFPPIPIPIPWPNVGFQQKILKTAVTNKVIHRSGILDYTKAYDGGSVVETKNIYYDAMTGKPVLTEVNNNYDAPIYSYSIPAHWQYEQMGAAYENLGLVVTVFGDDIIDNTNGTYTLNDTSYASIPNGVQHLIPGDELLVSDMKAIVLKKNKWNDAIIYLDGSTDALTPGGTYSFKVVRSGNRNLLEAEAGKIVSLVNPTSNRELYECTVAKYIPGSITADETDYFGNFHQCFHTLTGLVADYMDAMGAAQSVMGGLPSTYLPGQDHYGIQIDSAGINYINIYGPDCSWRLYNKEGGFVSPLSMKDSVYHLALKIDTVPSHSDGFSDYYYSGFGISYYTYDDTGAYLADTAYIFESNLYCSCGSETLGQPIVECDTIYLTDTLWAVDSILQTSAITYSDVWPMDFQDVRFDIEDSYLFIHDLIRKLPFSNGSKGIWRQDETYAYYTDRKQTDGVDLSQDGTFSMTMFNWKNPFFRAACDASWIRVNDITRYNPYNFETENRDVLDLYSAALYGFKGSLATAVSANAEYFEIGFESFENLPDGDFTQYEMGTGNIDIYKEYLDVSITYDTGYVVTNTYEIATLGDNSIIIEGYPYSSDLSIENCQISLDFGTTIPPVFNTAMDEDEDVVISVMKSFLTSSTVVNIDALAPDPTDPSSSIAILNVNLPPPDGLGLWMGDIVIPTHITEDGEVSVAATSYPQISIVSNKSHTGYRAMAISEDLTATFTQSRLFLKPTEKYVLGAWVSRTNESVVSYNLDNVSEANNFGIKIQFFDASDNLINQTSLAEPQGPVIEGWQRIEKEFSVPVGTSYIALKFHAGSTGGDLENAAYFDDLRIHPADASFESYVYSAQNYRLMGVLNNNNYASKYYYDEEGNLYLVKKETELGIRTIQESRFHSQKPTP